MVVSPLRPHSVPLLLAAGALALPMGATAQVTVQAESADVLSGVEAFAHGAASGGARVRNFDDPADLIRFDSWPADTERLDVRFSLNRETFRQASLLVDGVEVRTLTFHPTEDWNSYQTKSFEVDIAAGATVELRLDEDDMIANRQDSGPAFDSFILYDSVPESQFAYRDALGRMVYEPYEDSYGDHWVQDFSGT